MIKENLCIWIDLMAPYSLSIGVDHYHHEKISKTQAESRQEKVEIKNI